MNTTDNNAEFVIKIGGAYRAYACKLGERKSPHTKTTLREFLVEGKEPVNEGEMEHPWLNKIVWTQITPGGFPTNLIVEGDINDA